MPIEFRDSELCDWQTKLTADEVPTLGEVYKLAKTAQKIRKVLDRNGFLLGQK